MANLSRTLSAEQKQHLIKVKIFLEQVIIKGLNRIKQVWMVIFDKCIKIKTWHILSL